MENNESCLEYLNTAETDNESVLSKGEKKSDVFGTVMIPHNKINKIVSSVKTSKLQKELLHYHYKLKCWLFLCFKAFVQRGVIPFYLKGAPLLPTTLSNGKEKN